MASFNFGPVVLNEGTTFIFGSWVCIANGSGGFKSHSTNLMNPKAASPASPNESGEVLLPELINEIERLSVCDVASTRSPTTPFGLDPIYSEMPHNYTMFGLCNAATTYMAAMQHRLANGITEKEDTTCWEAPIYDSYPDSDDDSTQSLDRDLSLIITSTPRGSFVYWKGFEPTKLLDDPRLIAYIPDPLFQHGKPLSPIEEIVETTLVDYSTTHESPPERQICATIPGAHLQEGDAARYSIETLDQISNDELSANAPADEPQEDKEAKRERNRRRTTCRTNTALRVQNNRGPHIGPRNLQQEFDDVGGPPFQHPVINLAEPTLLMQSLPDTPETRRMQFLTKEAMYQMDRNRSLPAISR
jgi:hypothetical protein